MRALSRLLSADPEDADAMAAALRILAVATPLLFTSPARAEVFAAAQEAHAAGLALSIADVSSVLRHRGSYERIGGWEFLELCWDSWDDVDVDADIAMLQQAHEARVAAVLPPPATPAHAEPLGDEGGESGESITADESVTLEDFWAHLPSHQYIYVPTGEPWPAASVNARVAPVGEGTKRMKPSVWLDQFRSVEQLSWCPGQPKVIRDRLIADGGWIEKSGCSTFNLYRPPCCEFGDASEAAPWLDHIEFLYGEHAGHIVMWLAHRVQRPGEKINHALVLGGLQGIGKDTLLEPVKRAIGNWNFVEISPAHLLGRFNGFAKSVILRISEARDLGETDRFSFYDHSKSYIASPPDVLRVDEKNLREHAVLNVTGVVITTNHKSDGIYLPADDRRHFVVWSDRTKDDFAGHHWRAMYSWFEHGGHTHVAAYLDQLDLGGFDPKAPPPKTAAWHEIVDANRAPEDAELSDALDAIGNPDATTIEEIADRAGGEFASWLRDRKNRRQIPHRLETAGYTTVRNDGAKDGLYRLGNRRQVIYARRDLSIRDRIEAANLLVDGGRS